MNSKLIIDFISDNKNIIEQNPLLFIVLSIILFGLGWSISSWIQKNKMEANEERMKYLDRQLEGAKEKIKEMKENEQKVQSLARLLSEALEEKLNSQGTLNLASKEEDRVFAAVYRFSKTDPARLKSLTENLAKDLKIDEDEVNKILEKIENERGLSKSMLSSMFIKFTK